MTMTEAPRRRWLRPSIWDYQRLRGLFGNLVRNRRFQLRRGAVRSKPYLNVGCGGNPHPDFINLDHRWHPAIDLCWDVTRGIPLEPDSLDGVFTEHCLEHVPLAVVYRVLVDFRRMLRPGGAVRVVVPDGELYLDLYHQSRSDPAVRFPAGPSPGTEAATGITPMVMVNRAFRAFGHRFVYDYETLALLLGRAGFVDVRRETFGRGRDPQLLIDYPKRAANSLYVEASAPAAGAGPPPGFDVADLVSYLAGERLPDDHASESAPRPCPPDQPPTPTPA